MGDPALTPTSYLVLGLVGHFGRCTSYEMKRAVAGSIGYFWSFPHSQLYAEPARLAGYGLLAEDQEAGGRRRRTYRLTPAGRRTLSAWLADPTGEQTEIRDLALLKLFFGTQATAAGVRRQAEEAAGAHRARLAEYDEIAETHGDADPFHLRTLDLGLMYERAAVAFWESVAKDAR
jgi:DNA-binding PadR family transcriptional regulator